ncbi:AraC family transcriptional regulator [Persicobacter diffluens]
MRSVLLEEQLEKLKEGFEWGGVTKQDLQWNFDYLVYHNFEVNIFSAEAKSTFSIERLGALNEDFVEFKFYLSYGVLGILAPEFSKEAPMYICSGKSIKLHLEKGQELKEINVLVKKELLHQMEMDINGTISTAGNFCFCQDLSPNLVLLLQQIQQSWKLKNGRYLIKAKVYELLYLLIPQLKKELEATKRQSPSEEQLVREMQQYIQRNYFRQLTIQDLSGYFGKSPSSIRKMFREFSQLNFAAYLRSYRLQIAKNLLQETSFSVSDIVQMVGYKSVGQFSISFKKAYHISPRNYRESWLKTDQL